jgi:hypothetical protein
MYHFRASSMNPSLLSGMVIRDPSHSLSSLVDKDHAFVPFALFSDPGDRRGRDGGHRGGAICGHHGHCVNANPLRKGVAVRTLGALGGHCLFGYLLCVEIKYRRDGTTQGTIKEQTQGRKHKFPRDHTNEQ